MVRVVHFYLAFTRTNMLIIIIKTLDTKLVYFPIGTENMCPFIETNEYIGLNCHIRYYIINAL